MSRQRSQRADFTYFKDQEVRWGDMDSLGHVNNAMYLTYSESARIAYFDELFAGDANFMRGQGPILAAMHCDYHQQVHYPAQLQVAVGIQKIGNSSLVLACPVFIAGQDEAVADMLATIVWFDYREQKPMAVPDLMRRQPLLAKA